MKTVILALVALMSSSPLYAGDEVFSITTANRYRNMYAVMQNKFDSSSVNYLAGEIELKRSGTKTSKPFLKADFDKAEEFGSSIPAIDAVLSDKYKTGSFVPQSGDTLFFYRTMAVQKYNCQSSGAAGPGGTPAPGTIGPYPYNWESITGDIDDTTKITIRIEDVTTPSIGMAIDSVTAFPNPSNPYVEHQGSNIELYEHKVAVPTAMYGRTCRIRLIVERRGPSPTGIAGGFEFAYLAYSTYKCPWAASKLTTTEADSLDARYVYLAESYMNTVLGATHALGAIQHLMLEDTTFNRIMGAYYYIVQDTVDTDMVHYYTKNPQWDTAGYSVLYSGEEDYGIFKNEEDELEFPKSHITKDSKIHRGVKDGISILRTVIDIPAGVIRLVTFVPDWVKDVTWRVSDVVGKEYASGIIWPANKGKCFIEVPYMPLDSHVYLIQLIDNQRGSSMTVKVQNAD